MSADAKKGSSAGLSVEAGWELGAVRETASSIAAGEGRDLEDEESATAEEPEEPSEGLIGRALLGGLLRLVLLMTEARVRGPNRPRMCCDPRSEKEVTV